MDDPDPSVSRGHWAGGSRGVGRGPGVEGGGGRLESVHAEGDGPPREHLRRGDRGVGAADSSALKPLIQFDTGFGDSKGAPGLDTGR